MATIGIHYVRGALQGAKARGANPTGLLRTAGISQELLSRPRARVHEEQMTRLVQQIWQQTDDEFVGCTRRPCRGGAFAFLARNTRRLDSLHALFREALAFYPLLSDELQMHLKEEERGVRLEIRFRHPQLDPNHFLREFWMVIWHRFPSWLVRRQLPLKEVGFDYPRPAYHDELRFLFPCPQRFEERCCSLLFPLEVLDLAPARSQAELNRFLQRSPADLMTIPGEDTRYSTRIRSQLTTTPGQALQFPAFEQVAEALHLTPQTLRRRLKAEASSYQELKEEIRRDLAIELLTTQRLPINDIAHRLGFTEARSFTRAFKHWTGLPPSAYRHTQTRHYGEAP